MIDDPAVIHQLQYSEEAPMPTVRFRPGGGMAFGTWGRRVAWLDAPGSASIGTKVTSDAQPCGLAFDARGKTMAVGWSEGRITVHDAESGATHRVIQTAGNGPFNPVAISPDGTWLAGAATEREVRLYRVNGEEESVLLGKHADAIRSLAFSPDGRTLASASSDNTVKLWDIARREEYATLRGHTARLNGVAFHPDGDIVASASDDETVRLWDARTGVVILVLRPKIGAVLSVAFSPDGSRLAYGHDTVGVGEISGLSERRSLPGHTYEVPDVAFHRSSRGSSPGPPTTRSTCGTPGPADCSDAGSATLIASAFSSAWRSAPSAACSPSGRAATTATSPPTTPSGCGASTTARPASRCRGMMLPSPRSLSTRTGAGSPRVTATAP